VVVVANMGPLHGEKAGRTVAALHWRTGEVLWHVPAVRDAGHVRFLDADPVIVLGHRDSDLAVLDVATGKRRATWTFRVRPRWGTPWGKSPAARYW
jgi:hypothetical protein